MCRAEPHLFLMSNVLQAFQTRRAEDSSSDFRRRQWLSQYRHHTDGSVITWLWTELPRKFQYNLSSVQLLYNSWISNINTRLLPTNQTKLPTKQTKSSVCKVHQKTFSDFYRRAKTKLWFWVNYIMMSLFIPSISLQLRIQVSTFYYLINHNKTD